MVKNSSGVWLSVLILVGQPEVGHAEDHKNAVRSPQQEKAKPELTEQELHRQRTLEAIRRAVKGSESRLQTEQSYQEIPPERLGEFIGHQIMLKTYFGRKVEGTLKRVEGDNIFVDEHVGQGRALYPIDKTKLSGLKVLH